MTKRNVQTLVDLTLQTSRRPNLAPSSTRVEPRLLEDADKENVPGLVPEEHSPWGFSDTLIDPQLKSLLPMPTATDSSESNVTSIPQTPLPSSSSPFRPTLESTPKPPAETSHTTPQAMLPIDHLQTLLYGFSGSFPSEGIISTVNALLALPLLVSTPFYAGESATVDGKCPFCAKKLRSEPFLDW